MSEKNRLLSAYRSNFRSICQKYHLSLVTDNPEIKDPVYVCPISLMCYEGANFKCGDLTLEHVPPKSLGGKVIVLTDRLINNKDGSTSDKRLLDYFRGLNFKLYGGEIDTSIRVGDDMTGKIRVKMSIDASHYKPKILFKTAKSNIDALVHKGLFENWDGGKFHTSSTFVEEVDKKAFLKIAYLTAFSKIGYELIFGEVGLRTKTYGRLINYLNGNELSEDFPLVFVNKHAPLDDWSVGKITMPEELRCYVVNLTFHLDGNSFKYAVFLPDPKDVELDNLKRLSQLISSEENKINVQLEYLPFDITSILE